MADNNQPSNRGLTIRSFVVAIVAMFVMGVWIEYEELYNYVGGPLAENSPPNSAVGVIVCLMVIGGALYKFRKSLKLATAELVVVYSALVLSAPLMTQGMWHRFFALSAALPHNQDWKSYQSLPPMLWPHGKNLCPNHQFQDKLEGFKLVGDGKLDWEDAKITDTETRPAPVLSNGSNIKGRTSLQWTINRYDKDGHEVLAPGENFLFSMLVKTGEFNKDSNYYVKMQADDGPERPLFVNTSETAPTFALPGGFQRVGLNPVKIPTDIKDKLTFQIGISGGGKILVQDVQFFNVEAIEGAYSGRKVVTRAEMEKLDPGERSFAVVRPDSWYSWEGIKYLVSGYIPLKQWQQPAIAWGTLLGGLFMGYLGLNLLMRKQWVEHERFTFPLTILPKALFEETTTPEGKTVRPILRNGVMWIGFGITLFLCLLKGIHFYQPRVPSPEWKIQSFADYVNSPVMKSFLKNVGIGTSSQIGFSFCVLAIALLIETDILFSLWAMFLIYQLWNLFGFVFNSAAKYPGYPWEFQQAMGGFIMYAVLALIVGRHHLAKVFRLLTGRGREGVSATEINSYRTSVLLIFGSLATLVLWGVWTKMGAGASLFFFGYMLICGFAASRIRAECGAQFGGIAPYYGLQFMTALGGFAVFKSTAMLVATLASGFMCTTVFIFIAPVQVEMMELGRHFKVRSRDIGAGLTLGLIGGLFIGGFVLLCWMYGFGANTLRTGYPYEQNYYYNSNFRPGDANADRALAAGTLGKTPEMQTLNIVKNPDAKGLAIGAGITGFMAFMRMKFMWFPFHPLGYVLASSFFMKNVWFTLFIAWLARLMVFRIGGAQVIRRGLVPICVGMFIACVTSIILFDVVGMYLRLHGVVEVYTKMP